MVAAQIKKKYRLLRWAVIVLLAVLAQLTLLAWYITLQLKPMLKTELRNLVNQSTAGLYHMDYSAVAINFLTGSVRVENVKIAPDTSVYRQMINKKLAPSNLYDVELGHLLLKRIHLFNIYFKKKVHISQIVFEEPAIKMVNRHFAFNDDKPPRPQTSPYQVISRFFKSVRVDAVDFRNAKFKYINNNGKKTTVDSVSNIFISLKDWLIDAQSAKDTSRTYMLKDIRVYINDYRYATPDSMYYLKLSQLDFSLKNRKLNVKEFVLAPRYVPNEFTNAAGYACDRFSIKLNNLDINGMDLPAYIKKQEFKTRSINISNGWISVYSDGRLPTKSINRVGRYPHQLLQKISSLVTIDTVSLKDINVKYQKFSEQSQQVGTINFENTSGTVTNVTNAPKAKSKNGIMHAVLESYLMGQGKTNVAFNFNLEAKNGAFDYKGELGLLDGRRLNRITKPLGMLQVRRGLIRSLSFAIKADDEKASGQVDFRYNDFSVALFKQNKESDGIRRMGLLSMLANALVIYSDNPSANGHYTMAKVHYLRNPDSSFFSFIWRTLFAGIKYSVGLNPQKEKEIERQINLFKGIKAQRQQRHNK